MWADVQTKRFRTMMRHVGQAITKSKSSDGPPWLATLLTKGENKQETGDEEQKTGEDLQENGEEEQPVETDVLTEAEPEDDVPEVKRKPAAATESKRKPAAAKAPAAKEPPSTGEVGEKEWVYGFSKETYQVWRHPEGKTKDKETGTIETKPDSQAFDLMIGKFSDREWEIPNLMVSEWAAIQASLGQKRKGAGHKTADRIFDGEHKDGTKYFACRRPDRSAIWILFNAETNGQMMQCRTYEEDVENPKRAEATKEMFLQMCKEFVDGTLPKDQLTLQRKQRLLVLGIEQRNSKRRVLKRPAAMQKVEGDINDVTETTSSAKRPRPRPRRAPTPPAETSTMLAQQNMEVNKPEVSDAPAAASSSSSSLPSAGNNANQHTAQSTMYTMGKKASVHSGPTASAKQMADSFFDP